MVLLFIPTCHGLGLRCCVANKVYGWAARKSRISVAGLDAVRHRGDWLVMAATLTHLRSRLLLPADAPGSEAAEDEAEALRRQLVSRPHVRVAADWLERQPQFWGDTFGRGGVGRASGESPWHARGGGGSTTPGRVGDITELLRAWAEAADEIVATGSPSRRRRPRRCVGRSPQDANGPPTGRLKDQEFSAPGVASRRMAPILLMLRCKVTSWNSSSLR
jgi:hypothetical protein